MDPQVKRLLDLNVGPRAARVGEAAERVEERVKGLFRVIGRHLVHGIKPGETGLLDLPKPQVDALVEGGHVEPVAEVKAAAVPAAAPAVADPAADKMVDEGAPVQAAETK